MRQRSSRAWTNEFAQVSTAERGGFGHSDEYESRLVEDADAAGALDAELTRRGLREVPVGAA